MTKLTTYTVDPAMERSIEAIRQSLDAPSKGEVIRRAIALLTLAVDSADPQDRVTVLDAKDGQMQRVSLAAGTHAALAAAAPISTGPAAASASDRSPLAARDVPLPDTVGAPPVETPAQIAKRLQQWVMVGVSCTIFIALNLVVMWLIYQQLDVENADIARGILRPADRTITSGVFMTLIGATVVETGYAIRTIMRYLFNPLTGSEAAG